MSWRSATPSRGAVAAVRRASWADRALLAEALICLAGARAAVVAVPFRVIARRLAHPAADPVERAGPRDPELGRRIGWAVRAVATRTPWRSMCLEQAIAAKAMLRRRGISSTLFLGVARADDGAAAPVVAHAWLQCGDVNVTGGRDVSAYTVMATFADLPQRMG